jgi:hypothetical protein
LPPDTLRWKGGSPAAYDQAYAAITGFLSSKEACQVNHSELERELEGMGRELLRKLLQAHLDMRQPGQAVEAVRDSEGTSLEPTAIHERSVESIFGTVEVARTGYRAEGTASVHPLDGALHLPPEKYSLEVRRRAAIEAAKGSFDEGVKALEMYTGARVPKRQFEELVKRAAQDFEAFYAQRQAGAGTDRQTQTGSILVLTVDGKGVVMLPEDLRAAAQRAAAQRAKTFTARLGGGRRLHAKRMASVAAIYTVEPFVRTPEQILPEARGQETGPARPRPEHKRVWASLAQSPEDVIGEMFDEAARRDPERQKRWVALVDGNLPQIAHLEQLAQKRGVPLVIVVDFIHVAQYVWKAAGALFPNQELEQDRWTREHLLEILRGKASWVAAGMRRSATLRQMGAERKPVDECADYLLHYSPYLHYDKALAEGVPIATGVIEGACRHLVQDRMNLTGARWSLTGAEAVLRLRALRSSNDFDAYWKFHEQQEYERHHASRYAGHRVPETVPPVATSSRRSHPALKIVSRKADS